MKVCGAWSSGPGRNTNMKPPLRESSHSTSRMLVTRASTTRPRTSKRIWSPTLILKRSWMLSSIETSSSVASAGSAGCPVQNVPLDDASRSARGGRGR